MFWRRPECPEILPLPKTFYTSAAHLMFWRRPECPEILQFIPAFKRDVSLSSAVRILDCTWFMHMVYRKNGTKKEYTPQTQVLSNLYAAIYSYLQAQSFITRRIPLFSTNCNMISTILSIICQKWLTYRPTQVERRKSRAQRIGMRFSQRYISTPSIGRGL